MELYNKPISEEKQAIRKILKAIKVFKPEFEKMNFNNTISIMATAPKFIKIAKANERELKDIFNIEFLNKLEKLAE